jgi:hypothetical protein
LRKKRPRINQGVLRTYDIAPDGIRIVVDWGSMVVGSSFFVPCINTQDAIKELQRITGEKGWGVHTKVLVESNKLGVRIWRTL